MKNFKNIISYFICLIFILSGSFSIAEQLYKSYPVVDYKTDIELIRTVIPENFTAQNKVAWSRNIETPLSVYISAENQEKNILFYYLSPQTYIVLQNIDSTTLSSDIDILTNIKINNLESSDDLIKRLIYKTSPNAKDIKLISEKIFSDNVKEYLLEEFHKKSQSYYKNNMKMNRKITNLYFSNFFFNPYYKTYSFTEDGKEYIQSFITASAGFDYEITLSKPQNEKKSGKIIENYGIFSYKAPKYLYDNYKNDFLIFTANTMFNRKALDTLEEVKIQRFIELNPTFKNSITKDRRKNIPSNLFAKYYTGGKADYAEYISMPVPRLDDVRWITAIDNEFNKFDYKTLFDVWKQKIYTTDSEAFYNRRTKQFSFSQETAKKFPWVKLHKASDIEINRRYDSGF